MLLYFYEHENYGGINQISFANFQRTKKKNKISKSDQYYPPTCTVTGDQFQAPDFMASTKSGIFFAQTVKGIVKE
ncbi:hypothetical protein Ciccas_004713, partial [Cichlidogyrus casuarinus]